MASELAIYYTPMHFMWGVKSGATPVTTKTRRVVFLPNKPCSELHRDFGAPRCEISIRNAGCFSGRGFEGSAHCLFFVFN